MRIERRELLASLAAIAALGVAACGNDAGPMAPVPLLQAVELGVVLGSTDLSLTIFEVDDPTASTQVGLGPDGSPVTLAVRGDLAAVPLGLVPAVAIVDVDNGVLLRTVALPTGSGATGAAFVNDSIVLVANPSLNTVTPVNVLRGTTEPDIQVGRFPQAIVASGDRMYVLNSELENFVPAGPTTVSVLDAESLQVTATITLTGENAAAGAVGPDGRLYVLNSGSFGAADGSLSAINLVTEVETEHHPAFGDFPSALAFGPGGDLHLTSFAFGLAIWSIDVDAFVRDPADAIAPDGVPSASGLGFDSAGRLYTLAPDCVNPSVANRLASDFSVDLAVAVGSCPIGIAFTVVQR
ncbi:MAG: hypothetical protein V3U67_08435 [Gemmatimonadota bacterium]